MTGETLSWAEVVAASTADFLAIEAKREALADAAMFGAVEGAQRHGDGPDKLPEGAGGDRTLLRPRTPQRGHLRPRPPALCHDSDRDPPELA